MHRLTSLRLQSSVLRSLPFVLCLLLSVLCPPDAAFAANGVTMRDSLEPVPIARQP
jgi:hypothetical protein